MVKNITYNILPIDVDGDGIPDGNLIEQVKNGVVIARKFVENKKMEKIATKIKDVDKKNKKEKKTKVVFKEKALNKKTKADTVIPSQQEQPVVRVADATSFAQSLKTGAATGIGATAGSILVKEIFAMF
jgi:sRNA-binding protein